MNTVTTPALVLEISMAGFVGCPPDPVDARLAAETACPRCRKVGLRCRGFERGDRYRLILSCRCGWMEEA
jgi:hypothetical protein